jgi:hypothetical protein
LLFSQYRRVNTRIDIDPRAWPYQVNCCKADNEGKGCDHFKIDEGFDPHSPDSFDVTMTRYADHKRGENYRDHYGFDQANEYRA